MPDQFPIIDNTLLTPLTTRFVLQLTPQVPQWWMSNTVIPISIIDSSVTLQAKFANPVEQFATAGAQAAPAANLVLADTGQLAAGTYKFRIYTSMLENSIDAIYRIEYRNAANSGNNWDFQTYSKITQTGKTDYFEFTEDLALDERVRVIMLSAGCSGPWTSIIFRTLQT